VNSYFLTLLLLHIVEDSVGDMMVTSEICNQKLGGGMAVKKPAIMVMSTLFCDVQQERNLFTESL
jgi:hypothetical protein